MRRAFTVWLKRVLLPGRLPEVKLPEIADLSEIDNMLTERVQEWTRQWKAEGLEEGLEKGLEKGRKEGETTFLMRLLESRFGPFDETIGARLEAADTEQLLGWGERVLGNRSHPSVGKAMPPSTGRLRKAPRRVCRAVTAQALVLEKKRSRPLRWHCDRPKPPCKLH